MQSEEPTACAQAFAFALTENEKNISLTGKYSSEGKKELIKKPLALWETIIEIKKREDENEFWEILKEYSKSNNMRIATVARLESFPTRVLRRVLWFYNIDYQSKESFLRRITIEQIRAISETYNDLYGVDPKVPRCFIEGLYNFIRGCVPGQQVLLEDLMNEEREEDSLRYQAKGALAFNFFRWDMGFHKYPKAETDEILASTTAETFLSLVSKEKIFETNKEEGGDVLVAL
jgi:hypothetical protein